MTDEKRVGEVIEACTTDFVAQCYELYQSPASGQPGKDRWGSRSRNLYGVVYNVLTPGLNQGGGRLPGVKMRQMRRKSTAPVLSF